MLPLLFAFISAVSLVISCPLKEKIYPCTCQSDGYDSAKDIVCRGIVNDADLSNALTSLKGMKNIYSLVIDDAILNYIPHDLFADIHLLELEFLASSIMKFTDTDVAFQGLEDSLEILLVSKCSFTNSWDWSLLKNMKKLMRLEITEGDLESIEDDVKEISSLNMKDIDFSHNRISHVYEYAFANFTELTFLSLSNNLVGEVKRTMLPNPAPNLVQIDLGYNELLELPKDFFKEMPSLEIVSIPGNKILSLNEQVFAPVWEQLEGFQAMGNKIRCDCRMAWILEKRMPPNMRAVCDQPRDLHGKNLATLTSKDLWCYYAKEM